MRIKLIGLIFSIAMTFGSLAAPLVFAAADPNPLNEACKQAPTSPACIQASGQMETDPIAGSEGLIPKTARLIALVGGIAAVAWIVIGALSFITSAGDPQKVAAAKTRVLSGLIGLVVIALAWAIVGMVTRVILQT